MKPKEFTTTIKHCARCGDDHADLTFKVFTNYVYPANDDPYYWWCMCPKLNEPILMKAGRKSDE